MQYQNLTVGPSIPTEPLATEQPYLPAPVLRRICIALISAEHDRLMRKRGMDPRKAERFQLRILNDRNVDDIRVDEETLGFDSLALLDLILNFNRLFALHVTGIEDYLLVQRRIGDWVTLLAEHFSRAPSNLEMTFLTSGSSGTPKECAHPFADLTKEVRATLAGPLSFLKPNSRILSLVPPHHIYGFLFTALLPTIGNFEVLDFHRAGPLASLREANQGDLIVGTPFNFENLHTNCKRFEAGVHGVVSGGPTSDNTWNIVDVNGLESLTEIYGSTETAGLGYRKSRDAPFTLMSHLSKEGSDVISSGKSLVIQDKLHWIAKNAFQVHGRLDQVVQVGGVNVSLDFVRRHLMGIVDVDDATVRLDGPALKAFIKTSLSTDRYDRLNSQIHQYLESNLAPAARPKNMQFGAELPRNSLGKLCDW